jgi:hypothetical protein
MNFDEQIKQSLEQQTAEIDAILAEEKSVIAMMLNAYKGKMAFWMWFALILALITFGFAVWTGYHFFIADNAQDTAFWGVLLVILTSMNAAIKMWVWMEMNRQSTSREIKRLEFMIAKLINKNSSASAEA